MPIELASPAYRALGLIPEPVCNHPEDVAEVSVCGRYQVYVRFHDGTAGTVDLSRRVVAPNGGVFAALADEAVFQNVGVYLGAVTWPGEIDLAPDAMYDELKKHGRWVLE